ncbi:MAG: ATP-binding cassette domain-containing protein [Planctomycetaceae bacterium]|nr:ATP-binding cassette domain-containing protein [Planctomycetaceae bacterium]
MNTPQMNTPQAQNRNGAECLIHFEDVTYRTSDGQFELVVDDLKIVQGEKVAITGPSGSGKTTLLSLISGYKTSKQGIQKVLEHQLCSMNEGEREDLRLQQIGIVFQDFRLIEYLTVRDNISLSVFLSPRITPENIRDRVETIASQLQLQSLLDRYPNQLSQGERQRTAIGRAIFQKPRLILADEPTGNLDPQTASLTLDFLFQAIELSDATLVMVTHDHSLLSRFTRHIDMSDLRKDKCSDKLNASIPSV